MKRHLAALTLAILIVLPTTAAETVDAVWKEQDIEFTFLGIDTAYSCDVIEARIEMLLRHVGAAEDLDVSTAPCPGFDRPQDRLPINARFRTLVPAADGDANVVKAAWSEVVLGKKSPRSIVDRDCRLLEHFQKYVLPAIEHEVIEGSIACGASRRLISGRLKLNVLKPVEENASGASERELAPSGLALAEEPRTWGERMADSTIAEHPEAWSLRKSDGAYAWAYTQGLVSLGMYRLHQKHDAPRYYAWMKAYVDHYVEPDGNIRTLALDEFNIDSINSGKLLLPLLKDTGDPRYKTAIQLLQRQLQWQPRTHNGVYWHKLKYPWQVWLDGLYMSAPFRAEYAARFGTTGDFDDIVAQFRESYSALRDTDTGLLYHGWDESRVQRWANPGTGRSPGFWTRSLGWYSMALVDSYEHFPAVHPGRRELSRMLAELSKALLAVRDTRSKLWWQVPDQGGREGNYLEASGSAMIIYAWAKGARLGILEPRYRDLAKESFDGMIKELVDWNPDTGRMRLRNVCRSAGLGGKPYRDGSYTYYVSTDVEVNDAHGVGAFLLASAEIEDESSFVEPKLRSIEKVKVQP